MVYHSDGHDFEVIRVGPKTGFWLWRKALYKVYARGDKEPGKEILVGYFRNHEEATRAAKLSGRNRYGPEG